MDFVISLSKISSCDLNIFKVNLEEDVDLGRGWHTERCIDTEIQLNQREACRGKLNQDRSA